MSNFQLDNLFSNTCLLNKNMRNCFQLDFLHVITGCVFKQAVYQQIQRISCMSRGGVSELIASLGVK